MYFYNLSHKFTVIIGLELSLQVTDYCPIWIMLSDSVNHHSSISWLQKKKGLVTPCQRKTPLKIKPMGVQNPYTMIYRSKPWCLKDNLIKTSVFVYNREYLVSYMKIILPGECLDSWCRYRFRLMKYVLASCFYSITRVMFKNRNFPTIELFQNSHPYSKFKQ